MIYIVGDTHGSKIEFQSQPEDILVHVGDWEIGEVNTQAKKILIRGNHDIMPPEPFDFMCDGLLLEHIWFTHEPAFQIPLGAHWNICGHVHETAMNDIGYIQKPWHIVVEPNVIKTLDQLIFEAKERNEFSRIRN